ADRAQRERDGRCRCQGRVRAQEIQLERVVRHLALVGHGLALDAHLAVPSGGIGAGGVEELAPGRGDQPALWIPRRVVWPRANGPSVTGGRPSPSYRTHIPSGESACSSTNSPVSLSLAAKSSMYRMCAVTSSGAHLSMGTSLTDAGAPR